MESPFMLGETPNRTLQELKFNYCIVYYFGHLAPNRTLQELKYEKLVIFICAFNTT